MNKLRPIAQEIISMKREMLNEKHSTVVKRALEVSIDRMLVEGYIDLDIQLYLKDTNCSFKEFKALIESSSRYVKSEDELIKEYESLVIKMGELLDGIGLSKDECYVNVNLESDKINICKIFALEEKFLKKYFYFQNNSDEYFEKLMKKKGFIQQFAVLRLPRILSTFIEINSSGNEEYELGKSHSYFQADNKRYCIDLIFSIDSNMAENISKDSYILSEILYTINEANTYFEEKLSI